MTDAPPRGPMQFPATWDAVAAGYADLATHFARYAEEALRLVPPAASHRVLDVAAGPGTLAFVAAKRVARVVAVDFSPGMIEQITLRAAKDGVSNLEAAVMDAQALGLADGSFDAAYCLFGVMFFPERGRAFSELRRVLAPSGRVLVATWAPIERRPLMKLGFDALAEAIPELPAMPKGDLQHPDECVKELTLAGFRDVRASFFSAALHVDSAEHYLGVMERSGAPFAMLKKRLGAEGWVAAVERVLAALRRQIPEGGVDLDAEAILTHGAR